MKKILAALAIITAVSLFAPSFADAATRVRGYYRSNGTYVQPYYKTSPNRSLFDNYSTKGNYNPYTGKAGTKSPYRW